jgi:hypothetical protein
MKYPENQTDQKLEQALIEIRQIGERNPEKARLGRAAYLAEVKILLKEHSHPQAVSQTPFQRLNGWIHSIPLLTQRKERSPMFTVISTIMVIAALLFGGGGATVVAAQDSLPNQLLYPVKTLSEEVRFDLAGSPQSQLGLALSFATQRLEELAAMVQKGQLPPEDLATRLQLHLNTALQLAAGMEDVPMLQALQQVRATIQQMQQQANMLEGGNEPENALLERVREMLIIQNRLCELGLQAPAQLRAMFENHNHLAPMAPPTDIPVGGNQQNGLGPGPNSGTGGCSECTPLPGGAGAGVTPNAGNGAGSSSGGCMDPNCTPVQDGSGPGPGANNGTGSEGGSGSASGGCMDCEPVQDGSGPGSGPNNGSGSDSGGPGSASGGCTDCTPVQDGTGPGPGPNNGWGSDAGSGSGSGGCTTNCTPVQDGTGSGIDPNPDPGTGAGGNGSSGPGR